MSNEKGGAKRGLEGVFDRAIDENFGQRLEQKLLRRFACGGLSLLLVFVVAVPLFLILGCVACADFLKDFPP